MKKAEITQVASDLWDIHDAESGEFIGGAETEEEAQKMARDYEAGGEAL